MDDLEFVQRCSKRDEQSWNEFVDKYSRLIYNYIYSILRIKGLNKISPDYIDDIFQEIFVLLTKDNFQKLKSFKAKNGCTLASWLRQVTINYTIDYLRKLKPTVSLDEEDDEQFCLKDILADDAPAITETLSLNERLTLLKDCIESLNKDDKYFLQLHINQGLTLEEMKGHLKISRGAIDMRKSRIIDRLRECFKAKGFKLDF